MKLIPKQPDTSVNVSKVSPVLRSIQIFGGLIIALIGIYIVLGLLVNVVAPYIPDTLERKMGEVIISEWPIIEHKEVVESYENILTKLIGEDEAENYSIRIVDSPELNAFAIPGNIIVVFSGLVDEVDNEEVIAFVLAHELGHFKNRDHIKKYGRVLVLSFMVNFISGSDSTLTELTLGILSRTEMKFSQKDELNADAYGVNLINNTYGSYKGAVDFFEMIDDYQNRGKFESYFDSHPHPEKRIDAIKSLMNE